MYYLIFFPNVYLTQRETNDKENETLYKISSVVEEHLEIGFFSYFNYFSLYM